MKTYSHLQNRSGFTLIEIMVVVAIVGLIASIGIPNFLKAREAAQTRACISNLKTIDDAKQLWALDSKKNPNDTPTQGDLVGTSAYPKKMPVCPTAGTYSFEEVGSFPTCTQTGHTL